jgi:hypothetical protein
VKLTPEADPVLGLIDAMLSDIDVRSAMYVARRREDGDADTFVIQFGEDGRLRLGLPDLASDASIVSMAAEAQARLTEVLGVPVPLCPRHPHALLPTALGGRLTWVCPDGGWRCPVGDYAELAWPHFDSQQLAPILAGRLQRRGITGWLTLRVDVNERGLLAELGVPAMSDELTRSLEEAAAPLPVHIHKDTRRPARASELPQ